MGISTCHQWVIIVVANHAPYGYTGEWYGGYIDLLFLRARWYAPETGTFLSVDPVETKPPYQYVGGNVVNRVDPSGLQSPENCTIPMKCYTPPPPPPTPPPYTGPSYEPGPYLGLDCNECRFKDDGYSEGYSAYLSVGLVFPLTAGHETVYDFPTMERGSFYFQSMRMSEEVPSPGVGTGILEGGLTSTYVKLRNLKSWRDITEYKGPFDGTMQGANTPILQVGGGLINFRGRDDDPVSGTGFYALLAEGFDFPPPPYWIGSYVEFATFYTYEENHEWYTTTGTEQGYVKRPEMERMQQDILYGRHLPMPFSWNPLIHVPNILRWRASVNLEKTWMKHQTYYTKLFPECRKQEAGK